MLRIQISLFVALSFCFSGLAFADPEKSPAARRVMTWVPPYATDVSKKRLDESFDGVKMKDGLTHIGLQFWNPTKEGGVQYFKADDAKVAEFRDWAHQHKIRVMMCIYNAGRGEWDWELASSAFDANREKFVEAIVQEILRLNLDGVDIDLEGKGNHEPDKEAFVLFIRELSKRLHKEGKELTIDTFSYRWHAPRRAWWSDLLPHIDGLHVMGYAETGASASPDWRSYDSLKKAAGEHSDKLLIGMPGKSAEWQGQSHLKHLQWVSESDSVGLAIWDARLTNAEWRTKETWEVIRSIKTKSAPKKEETK